MEFKETEILEFKKSTSELKEAIVSIVSILNKHKRGGVYFGIKSNGEVVGQSVNEKTLRDISQKISNSIEPKIFPKVYEKKIENKVCIVVEFSGENVPYYAFGRAYIRVADEDKPLSAKELEKLILKRNKFLWDEEISEKSVKDVNLGVLKKFIDKANVVNRINFGFTNAKDILNKLGLMNGKDLLKTVDVLFCNKNSLEVQAAVFAGNDKVTFLDIKQFKGNLFNLLEESETYIKEHIDWRAELKSRERREIPEIPVRAITEALVNSFIHRDYTNHKGNEIAIFKNRIEIYNPGEFPEGYDPKDFFTGNERSILRNPLLANTLYLSRDIERWGSGIKRIYDVCKEADVKLEFQKLKSGFLVVFYRKEGPKRVLKKVLKELTNNQQIILREIEKNSKITNDELANVLKISARKVRENISKLKENDFVERVGGKKIGYWKLKEKIK